MGGGGHVVMHLFYFNFVVCLCSPSQGMYRPTSFCDSFKSYSFQQTGR